MSSATNGLRKRCFCSSLHAAEIRWLHFQFWLNAWRSRCRPSRAGHHQRLGDEIGFLAAVFFAPPWCGSRARTLLDNVPSPSLARGRNRVAFERDGANLLVSKFARQYLQERCSSLSAKSM